MPIHRPLFYRLTAKSNIPGLPCPHCPNGKLKLVASKPKISEPKYSSDWREKNWDDWEPDHNVERWSAELRCDESACGEIVNMIGDVEVVQSEFETENGKMVDGLEDVLRIRAVFPAPPLIRNLKNTPYSVKKELETAFMMYWTDTSACVARLRTAVERLLDDQKIPKQKRRKKGKLYAWT